MGNWLKRVGSKTKATRSRRHEGRVKNYMDFLMEAGANTTQAKKGRHYYKMHTVPCVKCGVKFKINRRLKGALDHMGREKTCPKCAGVNAPGWMYQTKKEKQALERFYEASKCSVREMTAEEKKKYGIN